jgi:hypothetical protein
MMDLDEELTLRIKTVFDNFDDGNSDMGWALLREKYPEKSGKKIPLYWFAGAAASLLIVLGLWLLEGPNKNIEGTKSNVSHPQKQKNAEDGPMPKKENIATTVLKDQVPTLNKPKKAKENVHQQLTTDRGWISHHPKMRVNIGDHQPNSIYDKITTNTKDAVVTNQIDQKVYQQAIQGNVRQIEIPMNTNSIAQANANNLDSLTEVNRQKEAANVKAAAASIAMKKTTEEFLAEQSQIALTKTEQKVKKDSRKSSYEVFTGTFLNYYADNDVKVNAGFGVNANLKVSEGLFLSVGAGVSQNKISYDSYVPTSVTKGVERQYAVSDAPSSVLLQNSSVVSNVQLNAQLLSLDLPVMLKFYPSKRQNFYFSTGFNSNSYFAQRYAFTYTVLTASSFAGTSRADREETEESKFRGFEFANSAIFAIGINQKIGKTNSIIFEPYFKPALGNMGDKNLKINTVGLNLRFSFNSHEKK